MKSETKSSTMSLSKDEEHDKMVADMEELKQKIESKRKGTVPESEISQATFRMVHSLVGLKEDLRSMVKEIAEIKTEVNNGNSRMDEMERSIMQVELDQAGSAVVVRNIPPFLTDPDARETQKDLKENFEQILRQMDIYDEIKINDIYRLKSNKKLDNNEAKAHHGKGLFEPVKVCFSGRCDRNLFTANLKKLKNTRFNQISIGPDIPKSLMTQYRDLDEKGYEFRKQNPGSRSIILTQSVDFVLKGKKKGETKFSIIS